MKIKNLQIHKILNSLGEWSLEVHLYTNNFLVEASVPKGKSEGKYEAMNVEADEAILNFDEIKNQLLSKNYENIKQFDDHLIELDGTANKGKLGANLVLALSIAMTKALAKNENKETFQYISEKFDFKIKFPQFQLLIFEGGKHGSKYLTIQEFMLVIESVEESKKVIEEYEKYLKDNGLFVGYGLEGAYTSAKLHDIEVLDLLKQISPTKKIALDIAESSREGDTLDYEVITKNYNIFSIEDPKHEEDYKGWKSFYKLYGDRFVIIADDLTTTNKMLIQNAQREKLANGVIIKPNQIGTVSETIDAVKQARKENWKIVVSHRGGETNDNFIADLAVGIGADYVKFGGLERGERISKYNRILQIKEILK